MSELFGLVYMALRLVPRGLLAVFDIAVSISWGGMLLVHTKCVVKHVKKEARACVYEVVLTMMMLICEEWIGWHMDE